jgi:hypothetical protein
MVRPLISRLIVNHEEIILCGPDLISKYLKRETYRGTQCVPVIVEESTAMF